MLRFIVFFVSFYAFDSLCIEDLMPSNTLIANSTQCPEGWDYLNGRCLVFKEQRVNFEGAKEECSRYNGVLAPIRSENESRAIFAKHQNRYKSLYIGTLVPTNRKGDPYVNLDGTQSDRSNLFEYDFARFGNLIVSGTNEMVITSWGPCLVSMATNDTTFRYPVPCRTPADGFICQVWSASKLNNEVSLSSIAQLLDNQKSIIQQMKDIKRSLEMIRLG